MRKFLTLTIKNKSWNQFVNMIKYVLSEDNEDDMMNRYIIFQTKEAGRVMIFHSDIDEPNYTMLQEFNHLYLAHKVDHFMCCDPEFLTILKRRYHIFPNAVGPIRLEPKLSYSKSKNEQVMVLSAKVRKGT